MLGEFCDLLVASDQVWIASVSKALDAWRASHLLTLWSFGTSELSFDIVVASEHPNAGNSSTVPGNTMLALGKQLDISGYERSIAVEHGISLPRKARHCTLRRN